MNEWTITIMTETRTGSAYHNSFTARGHFESTAVNCSHIAVIEGKYSNQTDDGKPDHDDNDEDRVFAWSINEWSSGFLTLSGAIHAQVYAYLWKTWCWFVEVGWLLIAECWLLLLRVEWMLTMEYRLWLRLLFFMTSFPFTQLSFFFFVLRTNKNVNQSNQIKSQTA